MSNSELYTRLLAILDLAGLEISPSEVHGIIAGAIVNHLKCGASPDLLKLIEPQASPNDTRYAHVLETALELYRDTSDQLFDDAEQYDLLLPDDDSPIDVRTSELAAWCKGYTLGLLHNQAFSIDQLPSQGSEIVRDMMQIAEAAAGNDSEDEEDWALAELHEYVKVGSQLIFEFVYTEKAGDPPATVQ